MKSYRVDIYYTIYETLRLILKIIIYDINLDRYFTILNSIIKVPPLPISMTV